MKKMKVNVQTGKNRKNERIRACMDELKPVQEENDLMEKENRNVELYKDSLYSTKKMIKRSVELIQGAIIEIEDMSDQAVELIQGALIDIKGRKRELDVILSELNDTFYKLM